MAAGVLATLILRRVPAVERRAETEAADDLVRGGRRF
jgi:hypothetical protein